MHRPFVTASRWIAMVAASSLAGSAAAQAQSEQGGRHADAGDLAKQTQNPGAPLVSLPLQFNFNGDIGPHDRTQLVLNIQPVLPVPLSKRYAIITRWILPILAQPDATSPTESTWGFGDLNPQLFFAANFASGLTLGLGGASFVPTATDARLGTGQFAIGPAALAVYSHGALVVGALATYLVSIAGNDERADVSLFTAQPFVNVNLPRGSYLVTAPLITHDWEADDTTLPLGGGVGKIFVFDRTPVNMNVQAYANVIDPDGGPKWQIRLTMQYIFPQPTAQPGR